MLEHKDASDHAVVAGEEVLRGYGAAENETKAGGRVDGPNEKQRWTKDATVYLLKRLHRFAVVLRLLVHLRDERQ